MFAIDPFALGQIASAVTAILALSGVILLKSARLRSWCTHKMDQLRRDILDDFRDIERDECCATEGIADLQERVRRLEEICENLAVDNRDYELQRQ